MAGNYPLTWNNEGERFYETGVKKTVLYLKENKNGEQKPYAKGVA